MVRPAREDGLLESRFRRSLRHYWWVVVLFAALVAAAGFGLSFVAAPWPFLAADVPRQAGRFLYAGSGALAGAALGVGLVSLLRLRHRRVRARSVIEQELDLPVLASVPAVGRWGGRTAEGRDGIGFAGEKGPLLVASLGLATSLKRRGFGRTVRVLLVAGATSGEGTSVTAANLALCMAVSGDRVILVDCDLRHPSLDHYLQMDDHRGLSDVLRGDVAWRDAVLPVSVARLSGCDVLPVRGRPEERVAANLYCLPSGSEVEDRVGLFGAKRMRELLKELASITDYVILDGPPFFVTADALDLADEADGILVVSRLGAHTVDEMRRLSHILAGARAPALGVVVTGADLKGRSDVTSRAE